MKFQKDGMPQPAGTQFLGLVDSLIDLFKETSISNVEVVFISYKLDSKGKRIVADSQYVGQIRFLGIKNISKEVREELRKQCDTAPLLSLMVLWIRPSPPKLGILNVRPIIPDKPFPKQGEYTDWEKQAIGVYTQRNSPGIVGRVREKGGSVSPING